MMWLYVRTPRPKPYPPPSKSTSLVSGNVGWRPPLFSRFCLGVCRCFLTTLIPPLFSQSLGNDIPFIVDPWVPIQRLWRAWDPAPRVICPRRVGWGVLAPGQLTCFHSFIIVTVTNCYCNRGALCNIALLLIYKCRLPTSKHVLFISDLPISSQAVQVEYLGLIMVANPAAWWSTLQRVMWQLHGVSTLRLATPRPPIRSWRERQATPFSL